MIGEEIKYKFGNKRFIVVVGILLLMWGTIIAFFYIKLDEVTKGPCGICSELNEEEINFYRYGYSEEYGDYVTMVRTYYPNGSSSTRILAFELNSSVLSK